MRDLANGFQSILKLKAVEDFGRANNLDQAALERLVNIKPEHHALGDIQIYIIRQFADFVNGRAMTCKDDLNLYDYISTTQHIELGMVAGMPEVIVKIVKFEDCRPNGKRFSRKVLAEKRVKFISRLYKMLKSDSPCILWQVIYEPLKLV